MNKENTNEPIDYKEECDRLKDKCQKLRDAAEQVVQENRVLRNIIKSISSLL